MNEETTTSLIDTALASGSASALDPEERQLQELVLAIRDDAPTPAADFKLRMDARVAAGFPSRRRRAQLPAVFSKRPQLAALGAAASLLIGVVVIAASDSDRALDGSSGGTSAMTEATPAAGAGGGGSELAAPAAPAQKAVPGASEERSAQPAPSTTSADSVIAPQPPPPSGGFVGGASRRVERSAALVLAPERDELDDVGDRVIAVTDRYRGIVMRSSITSADENVNSSGSFDLRIPVRNLRSALRDLSALADVESRTENADDVTASFVSARTRLEELNAERRGLLRRLEKATTDQAVGAIRARLRIVNAQIEGQMSTLEEMRRRTSYATVTVSLVAKDGERGSGGIGDGARDLRDSLVDSANLALRVLGVALPIGLVLGLVWISTGLITRRRREAALD